MPVFKRHHFEKLLELARKGRIAPLYLLVGKRDLAQELLKRLEHSLKNLGLWKEEIDLEEKGPNALLNSLLSPCLLGRKLIRVKKEEVLLQEFPEELPSLLQKHKQKVSLLLSFEALEESHPLYRFAVEQAVLLPLPSGKSTDLLRYEIPEILAEYGKKMDRDTAEYLFQLVGEDLEALRLEIEKLALFVGERPVVTRSDVEEIVSPRPEEASYKVLETLLTRGPTEALYLTKELVTYGIHPLGLVKVFLRFFKGLWMMKEISEREEKLQKCSSYPSFKKEFDAAKKRLFPERIPPILSQIHPYAAYRLLLHAKRFPAPALIKVFGYLQELDRQLKFSLPPEEAFYQFFWRVRKELS